jgi:hypothetical protein
MCVAFGENSVRLSFYQGPKRQLQQQRKQKQRQPAKQLSRKYQKFF